MRHGAYILARYSTENQSETSIEVQVERCTEWCTQHSIPVLDTFADRAISGMKETRPEYQRMMQSLNAGGADTVVIYDQSRMFRNMVYWFQFRETLQRIGVHVVSVTQPTVGGDLSDPAVFLNEGVTALFNQMWVLQTQQKVREGVRQRAKSGKHTGGTPALGYRVEDERLVVDEKEAETVRLIFEQYAAGKSYIDIIKELNRRGLKTKRGNAFGKNSLHDLLKNEKYVGRSFFGGKPIGYDGSRNSHAKRTGGLETECPAIVPQELFDAVQKRINANRQQNVGRRITVTEQPLKGRVFCGACGGAMTIHYKYPERGKERYEYYKCAAKQRGKGCAGMSIRKDELEGAVANAVLAMLGAPKARERLLDVLREQRDSIVKTAEPKLKELQSEYDSLAEQIEKSVDAVLAGLTSPSLIERTNAMEARKQQIADEIEALKASVAHSALSDEQLSPLLDKLIKSAKKKPAAILSTVLRVEVHDDTIKIWTIFDDDPAPGNGPVTKSNVAELVKSPDTEKWALGTFMGTASGVPSNIPNAIVVVAFSVARERRK